MAGGGSSLNGGRVPARKEKVVFCVPAQLGFSPSGNFVGAVAGVCGALGLPACHGRTYRRMPLATIVGRRETRIGHHG